MDDESLKAELMMLDYNLDAAMQSDGEQGSHHANNRWGEEWKRNNPALLKWIIEFKKLCNKTYTE